MGTDLRSHGSDHRAIGVSFFDHGLADDRSAGQGVPRKTVAPQVLSWQSQASPDPGAEPLAEKEFVRAAYPHIRNPRRFSKPWRRTALIARSASSTISLVSSPRSALTLCVWQSLYFNYPPMNANRLLQGTPSS